MRARALLWLALAALVACGSEGPDDELHPIRSRTIPRILPAREAVETGQIPTLDPHTMNDAEVSKVLGAGAFCAFRYVSDGKPVLAWQLRQAGSAKAVVKLNGALVELERNPEAHVLQFGSDEVRLTVTTDPNERVRSTSHKPHEAKLLFEIGQQLRVGYMGYSICPAMASSVARSRSS